MHHLKPDRVGIIILDRFTSTLGKYDCGLGEHDSGECFDVFAFNNLTGELIRRHYKLKWEAQEFYETFKEAMRGSGEYEDSEPNPFRISQTNN